MKEVMAGLINCFSNFYSLSSLKMVTEVDICFQSAFSLLSEWEFPNVKWACGHIEFIS
jgi:hypothetical protein